MEGETKNYYDSIAKGYPELYHQEQEKKINLVLDWLPIEGKVLDCGAGAGVLNSFLSSDVDLVSFDISSNLLKLNSNSNKVQGSVTNLPFAKKAFDSICSFTMIQDVKDFERGIDEITRVLKDEGILLISFLKMSKKREEILRKLEENFEIKEKIEEEKDLILLLHKSFSL